MNQIWIFDLGTLPRVKNQTLQSNRLLWAGYLPLSVLSLLRGQFLNPLSTLKSVRQNAPALNNNHFFFKTLDHKVAAQWSSGSLSTRISWFRTILRGGVHQTFLSCSNSVVGGCCLKLLLFYSFFKIFYQVWARNLHCWVFLIRSSRLQMTITELQAEE